MGPGGSQSLSRGGGGRDAQARPAFLQPQEGQHLVASAGKSRLWLRLARRAGQRHPSRPRGVIAVPRQAAQLEADLPAEDVAENLRFPLEVPQLEVNVSSDIEVE